MMNFGRRDRFTEGKSIDKSALKPALYDPPTAAGRGTNVPARTAAPPPGTTPMQSERYRLVGGLVGATQR